MKRSFWATIRGKLVSRTLLVMLVPLLVLGGVAVAALTQLSRSADESVGEARARLGEDVVGGRSVRVADQVARELAVYLDERLDDALTWSQSTVLVNAARVGASRADDLGLDDLTVEEVEARFADDRQLGSVSAVAEIDVFLENSPDFKELFFTDANGYNVATSNQTSDMVQSDEIWWQHAWRWGVFVDAPEFDESAGVYSTDIAVRIDDGSTTVGVLKASLDIGVVQRIADGYTGGAESFDVTIVAANGSLLAETSSGHSLDRVLSDDVDVTNTENPRLSILTAPDTGVRDTFPEYSVGEEWIAGYSKVFDFLVEADQSDRFNLNNVESLDWIVVVEQPTEAGFAALVPLETLSDDIRSTGFLLSLVLVAVAALGLVLGVVSSFVFSRRITGPIKELRNAAVHTADEALPSVVARIDEMGPDDELPVLEPVELATGDEVEDLAHSFNSVQQTAVSLAAEQARMRRQNVATTFVSLGRRNQNLLSKQLEHINAMEQTETDSDTLRRLFQLDHLATRMRRNAESLLVLAGEETPRRFRAPVSVRHLVQAAGGEIEEFGRIEMGSLEDGAVEGGAASDIAHLLAELLENASRYSPPTAPIQVHGRRDPDGSYSLSVVDQGIGMKPADLSTANARLADPVEFDRAPSAYLGLFVVGHLARRHGLIVALADSPADGITATVRIPAELMMSAPAGPAPASEPDDGYRPEPVPPSAYENDLLVDVESALPPDDLGADPWFDTPVPVDDDTDEQPAATGPARAPSVPAPPPGLPTTTTMPITIPSDDVEPFSEIESPSEPASLGWTLGPVERFHDEPVSGLMEPDPSPGRPMPPSETDSRAGAPPAPRAFPGHEPPASYAASMGPEETPSRNDPSAPGVQGHPIEERTRSGFRRRRKGQEGAPASPPVSTPAAPEPPRRDAATVQASLARFRAGVTQGRVQAGRTPQSHPRDEEEGG